MRVYFKLKSDNQEITKEVKQLLEKYKEIRREWLFFYSVDISFIRKIKITKLKGGNEFDDILKYLFDQKKVEFLKQKPGFDGTSGLSSSSGISGTSGIWTGICKI